MDAGTAALMALGEESIPPYDTVQGIIDYEEGLMDADGVVELFQHLLDSRMVWKLQGHYGRMAKAMLEAGVIIQH